MIGIQEKGFPAIWIAVERWALAVPDRYLAFLSMHRWECCKKGRGSLQWEAAQQRSPQRVLRRREGPFLQAKKAKWATHNWSVSMLVEMVMEPDVLAIFLPSQPMDLVGDS